MASRGSDSGGMAAFFGLLILIWVVVTYYWVILGVGAAVGLFFAVRALVHRAQERRLEAAHEADILAERAERQHRWASRGDPRGIYGVEGADLMRSISPRLSASPDGTFEGERRFAAIAYSAEELDALLVEKPEEWRWAAFVSVLVQRRAEVRPRLRDLDLHYSGARGEYARNGREVALFVEDCMDELYVIIGRLESFMRAPAFMGVFGDSSDENTADAEGIVHVANRLMDFHECFLELAERCRDTSVPSAYSGLLSDCAQLMAAPLDGYRVFIDEMVELVNELPAILRSAPGDVDLGSIPLEIVAKDELIERIEKQVRVARNR